MRGEECSIGSRHCMMLRRFTRNSWSTPGVRRTLLGAVSLLAVWGQGWAQLSGLRDGDLMAPGAIEGVLVVPEGSDRSIRGVTVTLLRTRAAAAADAAGRFGFEDVPPGSYTLVAAGEGFSMLVITDVVVRPGQRVLLDAEEMPVAFRDGDVYRMEPVVVSARKQMEALGRYEITEQRPELFSTGNVDLPRTIDDPQPYYLFDRTAIARSGAATLEEFMQRRVPMDATKMRISDNVMSISSGLGTADNKTSINLNGFGPEHTVVLVNGRRLPTYTTGGVQSTAQQPDINGIPLAAIERVEILPASNTAVYGGDAIGGVVNIVLRRDFNGAEIEGAVENPFDGAAPIFRAAVTAGRSFNGGRTNLMISVTHTTIEPIEFRHRRALLEGYRARAWANDPVTHMAPSYANVPLGRTVNIVAAPVTRVVNGQLLTEPGALFGPGGADRTFVPEGYLGGGGLEPLKVNAGRLDLTPAEGASGRAPFLGLGSPLEIEMEVTAGYATFRHEISSGVEVFAEWSQSSNRGVNTSNPAAVTVDLPAAVPTNIFGVPVRLTALVPVDLAPSWQEFDDRRVVAGIKFDLPLEWVGQVDAGWASNDVRRSAEMLQTALMQVDAQAGRMDLVRDLRANPIPLERYLFPSDSKNGSWLGTVNLRAAGSLGRLAGGEVTGALGAGFQENVRRDGVTRQRATVDGTQRTNETRIHGGAQREGHVHGEVWLPVISRVNARSGIAQLDLQFAGRADRFEVDDVDAKGRDVAYGATSFTAGVRYRPVADVMLRASYASGFRVPDLAEIRPTAPPLPISPFTPNGWLPIALPDPKRGGTRAQGMTVSVGGNSAVRPERSENVTLGVVVEPRILPGLRVSVDWTVIHRRNEIRSIGWQEIVDNEELFPGRVMRGPLPAGDPYDVGPITFVDGTMMNVFGSRSVNYNLAIDYERVTARAGRWQVFVLGNSWQHYERQITPGQPRVEQINNGGIFTQGQPKVVVNAGVNWTGRRWSAGWTTRFYGHHGVHEAGVKGHGSEVVEEQIYHDVFASYEFARAGGAGMRGWVSGITVQVGAKNVFNTAPRFDGSTGRFYSPYGDIRRGSIYLSLKKRF